MSNLLSNINVLLITYIGLYIAAFSFLSLYAASTRSILKDLSEVKDQSEIPMIFRPDIRRDPEVRTPLWSILTFFYEVDLVIYHILVFIVLSIFMALAVWAYYLDLLTSQAVWLWVYGLAGFYLLLIIHLAWKTARSNSFSEDASGWFTWTTRSLFASISAVMAISLSIVILYVQFIVQYSEKEFLLIFVMTMFLALKFAWYLVPHASRNPLRSLLRIWTVLARSQEEGPKGPCNQERHVQDEDRLSVLDLSIGNFSLTFQSPKRPRSRSR